MLGLPMIVNRKTVDPTDPSSPEVVQLETAMGAAIAVFDGAAAVHVPRPRFAPVKTTSDLLVVRSDAYELADDWTLQLTPEREAAPLVKLVERVQAPARLRRALPGRRSLAAWRRRRWRSRATCASGRTSWSAGA